MSKPASAVVEELAHFGHAVHEDEEGGQGMQYEVRRSRQLRSSPYDGEITRRCASDELHSGYY